jgi:peptidoglycan/LPS O-acetylase OafA/YrhL
MYWLGLLFFLAVPWFNWVFDGRGNGLTMTWGLGLVILALLARVPTAWFREDAGAVAIFFGLAALARVLYHKDAYDPLFVGLFAVALYFALCGLQSRESVRVAEPLRRGIEFGANYSYTLYLIHHSILYFLLNWKGTGLANAATGFVISNLVAIVMYQVFERHHRALGKRLKNAMGIPTSAVA